MLGCSVRLPVVKRGQEGLGRRGVHAIQQAVVERLAGMEAVQAPLGLSFGVHPQDVAGIVPEEIGVDTHGTFYRGGQRHGPRGQYGLFSPGLLGFLGEHLGQLSAVVDSQRKGYLCV